MRRRERGFILVLVLFVALLAMTAALLVLGVYAHDHRLFDLREIDLHLTGLCDAGVAVALGELDRDPAWGGTGTPRELDRGAVDVEVTRPPEIHLRHVRSHGTYRGAERTVLVVVDLSGSRPRVVSWTPEGGDLSGGGRGSPGGGGSGDDDEGREVP